MRVGHPAGSGFAVLHSKGRSEIGPGVSSSFVHMTGIFKILASLPLGGSGGASAEL
jgi:hypothetical protein